MRDARLRTLIALGPIVIEGAPFRFRTLHPRDNDRFEKIFKYFARSANSERFTSRPPLTLDQLVEVTMPIIKSCNDGAEQRATVTVRL